VRIIILGGYGTAGLTLARRLLQETHAQLVLAGRNLEKAQRAAEEFNKHYWGNKVEAVSADAGDPVSLKRILLGADLLVAASSSASLTGVTARAVLEAGVDFLDIQYSPAKFEALKRLTPEIEKAGRCFITEAGFHPGLPLAAVRYGARVFERLDKALVGSVLNQKGGLPYTGGVDELVELFQDYKAHVYQEGEWKDWGKTGWKSLRMRFGDIVGERSCYPMDLAEMEVLPGLYPSIQETGFYIAGFNPITDYVITPLVMAMLKLGGKKAYEPAGKLLCWGTRLFSQEPYGVSLKVELTGLRHVLPLHREILFFHEDGYEFTVIPVVACLLQWMDGSIRKPGLHLMGALVDPERLVKDVKRMGVSVRETE
jgi:hypothetical protein